MREIRDFYRYLDPDVHVYQSLTIYTGNFVATTELQNALLANRMGLRRKEGDLEKKVDRDFLLPNTNDAPIIAGTFSKDIEF